MDVIRSYCKVWCAGGSPHSGIESGIVFWLVEKDHLIADDPLLDLFAFGIETAVSPAWAVAVEVTTDEPVLVIRPDVLQFDHLAGWTVEITDGQVPVWEDELYGELFRIRFT